MVSSRNLTLGMAC